MSRPAPPPSGCRAAAVAKCRRRPALALRLSQASGVCALLAPPEQFGQAGHRAGGDLGQGFGGEVARARTAGTAGARISSVPNAASSRGRRQRRDAVIGQQPPARLRPFACNSCSQQRAALVLVHARRGWSLVITGVIDRFAIEPGRGLRTVMRAFVLAHPAGWSKPSLPPFLNSRRTASIDSAGSTGLVRSLQGQQAPRWRRPAPSISTRSLTRRSARSQVHLDGVVRSGINAQRPRTRAPADGNNGISCGVLAPCVVRPLRPSPAHRPWAGSCRPGAA